MQKKALTRKILTMLSFVLAFFLFTHNNFVLADTNYLDPAQNGLKASAPDYMANGNTDVAAIIGNIISSLLAFIGIIFLILIIYAGFMWMTAGGNEEKVNMAISTAIRASVGLVIIAAAYLITKFLGQTVIGYFVK